MGKIIAVLNEKGGVAKTTTVKNLSVGLASLGKKVLAIDLDSSANLTSSLGYLNLDDKTDTIMDLFRLSEDCEDIPKGKGILNHDEGIDLIPSTKALRDHVAVLENAMQKEIVLRRIVYPYKEDYDYIFIDCPAGLNIFVTNAMFAADSIIVPVTPQFLGAAAMMNLFPYLNKIRKLNGTGTKPELSGILFTMVRTNVNNDKSIEAHFKETYKGKLNVYEKHIPNSVRFAESDGEGLSIYKYVPRSLAASAYKDFVQEFLIKEGDLNETEKSS